MKAFSVALLLAFAPSLRADLTVVQKIEGAKAGLDQVTIKMKGDKTRVEATPQAIMIIDGKSGDAITLLPAQKQMLRITGEKMRAVAEMASKYSGGGTSPEQKSRLMPTGKKEMVNGMETEIYTSESSKMKGTYWIATNYPNGPAILRQMQMMQPNQWSAQQGTMPDYRDFPGVPMKMLIELAGGKQFTITLVSIKQDPIADSEFQVPSDYTEMKVPAIFGGKNAPTSEQGASKMPTLPQTVASPSP